MKGKELKNSILQRAIQGKLVEHRQEEGTAKELLEQIRAEKERLVKEGKIKKQKALPEITEEEIPFDIPEGWEWVRFGDIMINRDSERIPLSLSQRESLEKIYDYYGASGVIDKVDNYIFDDRLLLIGEDGANLLTRSKPIAFIAEGKYWVNNHAHVIDCGDHIYLDFVMYYINAISLSKYVTGTAQPKMNQARLNSIPVSLPPLDEQKRIVAKIEELSPYVDQYDEAHARVEELNKKYPEEMQKSILQYAIKGKLVEQRQDEGTAQDLYQQIQAEKAKLVKEGKIKREKSLPAITEDEIPFDIPESWMWVRLENICEYIQRGKSPKYSDIKKYPVVAQKCNQWSGFSLEKAKFIDPETITSYKEERILVSGDLMWNSTGLGTLGRIAIYEDCKNPYELAVADSHVTVIRPLKTHVSFKYLYYYFSNPSVQNVIEEQSDGSTKQKELSTNTVKNYIVPLPPLEEQNRIAAKIEELLPLTKQLVK